MQLVLHGLAHMRMPFLKITIRSYGRGLTFLETQVNDLIRR